MTSRNLHVLDETHPDMSELFTLLSNRIITSPLELAQKTLKAFVSVIRDLRIDLCDNLKKYTKEISTLSYPHALVAENVALRILKIATNILQDDNNENRTEEDSQHAALRERRNLITPVEDFNQFTDEELTVLKTTIFDELQQYKNELETAVNEVGVQAASHVHSNETVMVYGYSKTIEQFLKTAARRRKFKVIVCQAFPEMTGHLMVENLSTASNLDIILIPDSGIHAMMARVNKVILSAYCIFADGSLCARSGAHALALSAENNGIPVIICSGMYKLCSRYHYSTSVCGRDIDCNYLKSPFDVLDYYTACAFGKVEVLNPAFDYIPARLVSMFITNIGPQSPSYMYRLIKEMYDLDQLENN